MHYTAMRNKKILYILKHKTFWGALLNEKAGCGEVLIVPIGINTKEKRKIGIKYLKK